MARLSLLETVEELVTTNSAEDLLEGLLLLGLPADTVTLLDEPLNELEPAPRHSLDIGLSRCHHKQMNSSSLSCPNWKPVPSPLIPTGPQQWFIHCVLPRGESR